jgi:hypothetical protein
VANASADKFKALALRHGEKAVMGVTTMLCVLFLYWAVTKETIQLTPDQLKSSAASAQSNIGREQKPEDILGALESAGFKNPGYEQIVEQQEKNLLVAANYRPPQLWVTPEPGAGLIRDQPELLAPTELYAYPGRGGAVVYALDESGNRIPDPDALKNQDPATQERRASGTRRKNKAEEERKKKEEEKKYQAEVAKKAKQVVGTAKKEGTTAEAAAPEAPPKEITRGVRWVAITGVLSYKALRENYLTALKRPEVAYPHFKQLDIERQVKQPDGSWSDWEAIDVDRNRQVLDNLPEEDEEWTPEANRISALVHPLPFLKAGFWERVHVGRMVPKEKMEVPKTQVAFGGEAGMSSTVPEAMSAPMPQPDSSMSVGDTAFGSGMYAGGGGAEAMNFDKTEADEIMIRALDFTVEQDTTYRFRVRVVVYNPNVQREDVSPGVDTKSLELSGPWSEPTEEVSMPPDVATYAINKEPYLPKKLDQVLFEVARWTPNSGVTVVRKFPAAPGEIIGEYTSAPIPSSSSGTVTVKSERVDFNSHQIVLDVLGGDQPIPPLGPGTAGRLMMPAVSLVMRPDGTVVVRSQARDLHDQIRKDMADNYSRELKAAEEEKKKKANPMPGTAGP